MPHKKQNLWEHLFVKSAHDEREERVLTYSVHRVKAGAHLRDVVEEDYVRHNASRDEVDQVICNPELVHAAREFMKSALESQEPCPRTPPH